MRSKLLPFLLILSLVACWIELEISAPSFPEIAHYFKVSEATVSLTISYNWLGFCLSSLFYGPLSECYGRRKVMLVGNSLLLIGAIGCVYASSIQFLLWARFIQGIGAATSAVITSAIIADIYQSKEAARLISIMNAVATILMAIAPVMGGFISKTVGWRGNYGSVAIVCMISWVLLFFLLPETHKERQPFQLKEMLQNYGRLLTNQQFISASFIPSLLYAAYMVFVSCAAFLYIDTFGLSLLAYTLHQGFIVAAFCVVSFFSDRFIEKYSQRKCLVKGMVLCLISAILLASISLIAAKSPYLITFLMSTFCMGFAACYPVIFAHSLEIFPEIKGTASSAIMGMRALICAGLVGLAGYLYNGHPARMAFVILGAIILGSLLTFKLMNNTFRN